MHPLLSRLITVTVICTGAGIFSVAACTRTTDRVIEPVGASDAAAPTPETNDAGVSPIGPIAYPPEPAEDFRLVRAPEFGLSVREAAHFAAAEPAAPGLGGNGGVSGSGGVGSDRRPVATGGTYY